MKLAKYLFISAPGAVFLTCLKAFCFVDLRSRSCCAHFSFSRLRNVGRKECLGKNEPGGGGRCDSKRCSSLTFMSLGGVFRLHHFSSSSSCWSSASRSDCTPGKRGGRAGAGEGEQERGVSAGSGGGETYFLISGRCFFFLFWRGGHGFVIHFGIIVS